jgi:hypothetical protein
MKHHLLWFKLWLLFSIGSILAGFWSAWLALHYHTFAKDSQNALRVEATDRMLAAYWFGCTGRWTISVECAVTDRKELREMRNDLETLVPGHCMNSAIEERVYVRIKDKTLGDR